MLRTMLPSLHARTTVVARSSAVIGSCSVVGASWLALIINELSEEMLTLLLFRVEDLRLCRQCSS